MKYDPAGLVGVTDDCVLKVDQKYTAQRLLSDSILQLWKLHLCLLVHMWSASVSLDLKKKVWMEPRASIVA